MQTTSSKTKGKSKVETAIQFTGFNFDAVETFVGGDCGKDAKGCEVVATKEGPLKITTACWIVKCDGKLTTRENF